MPFALLLIGVWLLIAGVRDTAGPSTQPGTLFFLLHNDFTGPENFVYWFIAIVLIGALGYIPKLKPVSTAFLVLIIMVLFLKKGSASNLGGGFFTQFLNGVGVTQNASNAGSTGASSLQSQLSALSAQNLNIMQQQQDVLSRIQPLGESR